MDERQRSKKNWSRFRKLCRTERRALLLAFFFLWLARISLRISSFSRIRAWLSRLPSLGRARFSPDRLCRLVETAGRRLPWATCLYRAIAGRLLLALFGWPSQLFLGVRLARGELQAHAWLVSEGRIVLGQQPEPFRPLLSIGAAGGGTRKAADSMPPNCLRSPAPPSVESLGWFLSRYTLPEGEPPLSSLGDPESFPWPELLRWWVRTGLFPLARHHLLRFGIAAPEPVRRTLDSLFARNALLQDLHELETLRLLRLFREEGIPAVGFKGPALARFLYGSPHLRCSTDLDLFLAPENLAKARTICREAGYRSSLDPIPTDLLVRGHTECGLLRRDRSLSFSLELHWAFLW
ncbi:hypothetical protein MAMC_00199 [Methylacidimicrobium cyclopophantes]|uniref:Microcin J25-processing protein McjB C-terminal domain-containing protein n=1 Tax=Methylacidimicrobium cyclopophantes TaxID=1041766 RepID=A0A5E6M8L0_9BACT|nr:hypothetical protein MAMC_00199 [Methylacidimicrobium cyclopophantes]